VVGVFILGAGEAGSRGIETMAEPAFVGRETLLQGKPSKNFALQRGSTPPNLFSSLICPQMPERIDIDTFVRELLVSEAVISVIRGVAMQDHRGKLVCKGTKVGLRGKREARSKGAAEVGRQSRGNINVYASGVGVEVRKAVPKGGVASPKIGPEGCRGSTAYRDLGDGTKSFETSDNVLPDGGVEMVSISKVPGAIPAVPVAEPNSPGSRGVGMDFGEEFG
jgi:hypothetical protein